ncbi:hypothetical protein N7495_003635 [Penicillium taxi]|uniref:uncharacterized protein n=1 Tax=Penicillium taxi TaxID=168475 RepID=UPI002544D588|nr:uncharacterized protein N7495_003635 [Penicillium taxi]KAJ5898891.1 hypothetical protein N7495_003635 [Penicillium taxi]
MTKRTTRDNMKINGFSEEDTNKIKDAFDDAMNIGKAVLTTSTTIVDPIFKKYFLSKDKDLVFSVFRKITGNNAEYSGDPLLATLNTIPNAEIEGTPACDGSTIAELDILENNALILCKEALLYGYTNDGKTPLSCDTIGNTLDHTKSTLGGALLHEWTHWEALVVPPLSGQVEDIQYGPWQVQNLLSKDKAPYNADSYHWFGNEVFWTVKCGHEFGSKRDYVEPSMREDFKIEDETDDGCCAQCVVL